MMKFSSILLFGNSHLDSKAANTGIYDMSVYGIIVNEFGNIVHSTDCTES